MNIAIIYGTTTGMTLDVADRIKQQLGDLAEDPIDVCQFKVDDLDKYDALLLGIPTWDVGEMQYDWAEDAASFVVPALAGKKIGLFGCGDQVTYADTFGDALGLLWDILEPSGPELIGRWPTDTYDFEASLGERDGQFLGLLCDEDTQPERSDERIATWCNQLKRELGLEAAAAPHAAAAITPSSASAPTRRT
ncbi:MAG: flavodoxin, partial [Planctomycetota bacterium]